MTSCVKIPTLLILLHLPPLNILQELQHRYSVIDDLLCQDPNPTDPPPPPTTQHPPGTAAQIFSPLTSMCLHVHSNSDNPEDYTNVDVAPCDGSDRQKWSLSSKGDHPSSIRKVSG